MTASLNVEENLLFSARYRLPATATPAQHRAQVRNSNITCPACTGLSCTQALCTPPPRHPWLVHRYSPLPATVASP